MSSDAEGENAAGLTSTADRPALAPISGDSVNGCASAGGLASSQCGCVGEGIAGSIAQLVATMKDKQFAPQLDHKNMSEAQ